MTDPRTLAIVREYDDLIVAIRARMDELEMTFDILDHRSGVQAGYSAKILGPTPSKCFGPVSLGCILGALGMKMVLLEDAAAAKNRRSKLEKRRVAKNMRPQPMQNGIFLRFMTPLRARELNAIRWAKVPPHERRRIARKAAQARWRRARVI
jgi:hypothetical protein